MNAMTNGMGFGDLGQIAVRAPIWDDSTVEKTYWGYIIRAADRDGWVVRGLQGVALFIGVASACAAFGMWLTPGALLHGEVALIKLILSGFLVGIAVVMLRYANRGTEVELQVDTNMNELREVVRNRVGKPTLLGRYRFDVVGGVFLDRARAGDGRAALMLRYRNTAQVLEVAVGPLHRMEALRDQLGQDLLAPKLAGLMRRA